MDLLKQLIDVFLHLDTAPRGGHAGLRRLDERDPLRRRLLRDRPRRDAVPSRRLAPLHGRGARVARHPQRLGSSSSFSPLAAVLGDTVNYWIGKRIGPRAFDGSVKFLKQEHLKKTEAFYEKHGKKTIILARFVPIVRTFAPFVAGVGSMTYGTFIAYNVIGGVAWVAICVFSGYFFGNIPIVKKNFSIVVLAIIGISTLPLAWEWWKARKRPRRRPGVSGGRDAEPLALLDGAHLLRALPGRRARTLPARRDVPLGLRVVPVPLEGVHQPHQDARRPAHLLDDRRRDREDGRREGRRAHGRQGARLLRGRDDDRARDRPRLRERREARSRPDAPGGGRDGPREAEDVRRDAPPPLPVQPGRRDGEAGHPPDRHLRDARRRRGGSRRARAGEAVRRLLRVGRRRALQAHGLRHGAHAARRLRRDGRR